eukprot:scaffold1499_cov255-Pinguiococcus_pyrenoidosus.AAC.29
MGMPFSPTSRACSCTRRFLEPSAHADHRLSPTSHGGGALRSASSVSFSPCPVPSHGACVLAETLVAVELRVESSSASHLKSEKSLPLRELSSLPRARTEAGAARQEELLHRPQTLCTFDETLLGVGRGAESDGGGQARGAQVRTRSDAGPNGGQTRRHPPRPGRRARAGLRAGEAH